MAFVASLSYLSCFFYTLLILVIIFNVLRKIYLAKQFFVMFFFLSEIKFLPYRALSYN